MNTFHYNSENDYVDLIRFKLRCKMEKTPGIVIVDGKEYHIDINGRFHEKEPPIMAEIRNMYMQLVMK